MLMRARGPQQGRPTLARRSQPNNQPEVLRESLVELLTNFATELQKSDVRAKVMALIPAFRTLRDLGSSLMPTVASASARDRIIAYLQKYPRTIIAGEELMVVSGISDWPRRVRELRVQCGWWIYSGVTFKQMAQEAPDDTVGMKDLLGVDASKVKPDQYVLMKVDQDRDAAHRWNMLNEIRKRKTSPKEKIIDYFRKNVGKEISGEELSYLAKGAGDWPRRVRELRTEEGWPIATRNSGRMELAMGVYVLEEDRQAYEHDRTIPDNVRVAVLQRDGFKCTKCGWSRSMLSPDDPRKMLELHHVVHHKHRGENTLENLTTLCNVDHDLMHRH
jgi:hypothetical protein